jgi:hypothetical protein
MNKSEQHKLNRLLSGGAELSVQEKEKMLSNLVGEREISVDNRAFSKRFFWVGSVAAAAAAALLVLYMGVPSSIDKESKEFTARGGATTGAFRIECLAENARKGPCTNGNRIAFGLLPPKGAAYFSAAALDEDGRLIRYFPSDTEMSLPLAQSGIQHTGITIGSEHHPGRYRVFGVFSVSPLSVEQMKQVIEAYAAGGDSGVSGVVLVKETELVVLSR